MMLRIIVLLMSCMMPFQPSIKESMSNIPRQDRSNDIAQLLLKLAPGVIGQRDGVLIGGPTKDTIARVHDELIRIATESSESRLRVIHALVGVLNDPKEDYEVVTVTRWRVAVGLLGELKAVESIEDLVRNLNRTSYGGSPVRHPPVRTALVSIGTPAIPRLLNALSDRNEVIRREASEALGEIGAPAVDGLLDALSDGGVSTRAGAVLALSRIGSMRVRQAIEIALRVEQDEGVRTELVYAVEYMNHVERLKHPPK